MSNDDWLNRCFTGITFQNLHHLDLGLNILGYGGKREMLPALPCIGYAARNVRSLAILGHIISLKELALILNPFSRAECGISLRTLVLEVHVLDVNLLDLLADHLPGLARLDLTYSWVHSPGCRTEVCFISPTSCGLYLHYSLLLRRRLFKKFMAECTLVGNCVNSSFVVCGTMMILVGHANKQYHDVYPDYADLLFLLDMNNRLLYPTMSLIFPSMSTLVKINSGVNFVGNTSHSNDQSLESSCMKDYC